MPVNLPIRENPLVLSTIGKSIFEEKTHTKPQEFVEKPAISSPIFRAFQILYYFFLTG